MNPHAHKDVGSTKDEKLPIVSFLGILLPFFWGGLVITAIVSLVNFRWTQMDFRFVWLLLAGMAYSGGLAQKTNGRGWDITGEKGRRIGTKSKGESLDA